MRWRTKLGRRVLAVTAATTVAVAIASAGGPASAGRPRYIDLDDVPKPTISGKQIVNGLEDFVERFPLRQSGSPTNVEAAKFLAKESRRFGFRSRIIEMQAGTPPRNVLVVEALKRGTTKPNEWIAFVAHYDVVAGGGFTVQGAYDDGSGTNIMRYFARAFSKVKTNRSIALLWFDAEENGLVASEAYTERLAKQGQKIQAAFGFDMVGIGYPARYCICIYHGPMPRDASLAVPVIDHVNFDYLKFPKGNGGPTVAERWPLGTKPHVCSCGANIRNSDEQNFAQRGWFTMRWTGMRTAADYPGYHQAWDTVPFMEFVAGGRKLLEKGTENTFVSAYYTAFVFDNLPYSGP